MFMDIDWEDPKFAKWHIANLEPLSDAQRDAAWEDDEIDDPPITEKEQKELCKQYVCKVELFHSNVCIGAERGWPKRHFGVADFKSLDSRRQRQIHRTIEKHAVKLYNKYVDPERRNRRIKTHNVNTLAPYWELRRLRNRYERVKKVGDNEKAQQAHDPMDQSQSEANTQSYSRILFDSFDSNTSYLTAINTQSKRITQNEAEISPTKTQILEPHSKCLTGRITPDFGSNETINSLSTEFNSVTVDRQPSEIRTNKTPEFIPSSPDSLYESVTFKRSHQISSGEINTEDFEQLNDDRTSTQK